ncbi:U4/U6.U5 tri-snRNP-associated protein 1, putative [Plasmodium vinckei brucechwatti]|uniref:U4/U6.U5 tri-snRNP-associated protein 1, putative n=1 Tax=Plasmodium vinckei brucechwatti TaxID=119398 RepID=A0A6V7SGR1_PLAVN|nr:U4/U6.U5 tri-snRNP-associated protein 1, putative [Plasmodium vinckei brucechwatti]
MEKENGNKKSGRGRKKKENANEEAEKGNDESSQVKTISEEFKDDIDDVQDWVNKTRHAMNKKLEPENIKYSDEEDEEEEEDGVSKKGKRKGKKQTKNNKKFSTNLKVQHKNEDIQNDMVLTLKDQNVLSDEDDCLVNEELKKQNIKSLVTKNDDNYWNQNYYNPLSYYEDDLKNKNEQTDNNTSINMLPKYDDKEHSFDVQINYNSDEEDDKKKSNIKNRTNKTKKNTDDLKKRNINIIDDAVTESGKAIQMKKRKIKNINKRKSDDAWSFLYDDPVNEEKEAEKNNGDKIKKEKNTVASNNDGTKTNSNILQDIMEKIKEENMNMEFNYFDDTLLSQNEEEKELYELLEKGNDLKKKKKERINYQNELLKRVVINDDDKKIDDDKNNNTIKLTDASEFCKSIYLPIDMHESIKKSVAKKNDKINGIEIAVSDRANNSNRLSKLNHNHEEEDDKDSIKNDEHDEEIDLSENGVSEIFNEIKLDEGLFGALEYLKTRGELNIEDKLYRNPENKPLHMATDKNDIKIDYKNDTGKVMTPKESFRYISWIFHGKKQGKNKLEKKIKRMEIERRFKENPMESLPTLNVLKKVQEVQKKVYFTLSNNG